MRQFRQLHLKIPWQNIISGMALILTGPLYAKDPQSLATVMNLLQWYILLFPNLFYKSYTMRAVRPIISFRQHTIRNYSDTVYDFISLYYELISYQSPSMDKVCCNQSKGFSLRCLLLWICHPPSVCLYRQCGFLENKYWFMTAFLYLSTDTLPLNLDCSACILVCFAMSNGRYKIQ